MKTDTQPAIRVLGGFDDPSIGSDAWDHLLASGPTDVVFLTRDWQREWWAAFGGDQLLMVTAERSGELCAIAPLFAMEDMLFIVGSGGSDYLDFIGNFDAAMLASMLDAARRELSNFTGIGLYHIPLGSRTISLLPEVAARLGLELHREGGMTAPHIDLTDAQQVMQILRRPKLRKEEARMRRQGDLVFRSARVEDLDSWLDLFFMQHTARWRAVGEESLERADARAFYRAVVHAGHRAGWLCFTMLEWKGQAAAFEIGLLHRGRHLAYLVSRDIAITRYSPGKMLEHHMIETAVQRGAKCFDYGLGDEPYKLLHATGVVEVANWFLYP